MIREGPLLVPMRIGLCSPFRRVLRPIVPAFGSRRRVWSPPPSGSATRARTSALGSPERGTVWRCAGPPVGSPLELINQNPLRGYPSSLVLYSMETNSSQLPRPVFTVRHEQGRDLSRHFKREDQEPAILALEAIGAKRVPVAGIQTCTWNGDLHRMDITLPFKSRPELFRAYELPTRRAADGAAIHSWSYGMRLGPRATRQRSNLVEGSKQSHCLRPCARPIGESRCKSFSPRDKSDCRAASTRTRVWAGRFIATSTTKSFWTHVWVRSASF